MRCTLITLLSLTLVISAVAETTLNDTNQYAYGANVGWINAAGDGTNGAVIGEYFCSGYLFIPNAGWVHLGDGLPANGYAYSNTGAGDYGVNHDAAGTLRGYAYGANIGWIVFEDTGDPRVDIVTGNFEGHVWGANIGWIALSNAFAGGFLETDAIDQGEDKDGDGIPDPWEYRQAGDITTLGAGSADGDAATDLMEYYADTGPTNEESVFMITEAAANGLNQYDITWSITNTRAYAIQQVDGLTNGLAWEDSGLGVMPPESGSTMSRTMTTTDVTGRVYRVKALRPLGL